MPIQRHLAALCGILISTAHAADKPNILVIWGDDIGGQNVSAYGMGTMGYTTPNIDSIGMQGIRFTDNGPEHSSWPHGGTTPFRGEKMSTYEGGLRVISMIKWPGVLKPGQILNGIQGHQDMFTSVAAAAGVDDVAQKMMDEKKQHIDDFIKKGHN